MSKLPNRNRPTRLWWVVLAVTSLGCQTYPPYGGYGSYPGGFNSPYQQPGMYGTPGMAPGSTVIPPSGIQAAPPYNPGPVTPATPYPNVPNGAPPRGADTATDPLGTPESFPNSTSNRPNVSNVPDGKLVPYYSDPDLSTKPRRSPAVTPQEIEDPADFKGPINGAEKATERLKKEEGKPPGVSLIDPEGDAIQFMPPLGRNATNGPQTEGIQTVQHTEMASGSQNLNPYGRAPNGQDWFRGLIDFDEQEKSWYLIYNPEPGAEDQQGGTISLIEHPHLKLVQGDDVVLVEGQFDPSQTDHHGHPKYRINVVRRLIP